MTQSHSVLPQAQTAFGRRTTLVIGGVVVVAGAALVAGTILVASRPAELNPWQTAPAATVAVVSASEQGRDDYRLAARGVAAAPPISGQARDDYRLAPANASASFLGAAGDPWLSATTSADPTFAVSEPLPAKNLDREFAVSPSAQPKDRWRLDN